MVTDSIKLADIKIKEEYQKLIRPLSPVEYEQLKYSIKKHGVKDPIDLNDRHEVIDGHHRTAISIALGLEYIPAIIHDFDKEELTEWQFIYAVNVSRRHLADFEKVELACKLNNYELKQQEAKKRSLANLKAADKVRVYQVIPSGKMGSSER